MAHFAKLDENNVVTDILVVSNEDIQNLPFPESEAVGIAYLNSFLPHAVYKQTSYNNSFRLRYAIIGGQFLPDWCEGGAFAPPKGNPSAIWDNALCDWVPPVPYPTDGISYYWNEDRLQWSPLPQPLATVTVIG